MRLTSKSQMTVPKEIREDLGIGPGSNVAFEKNDRGEFVLVNLDTQRGESPGERMVRQLSELGQRLQRNKEFAGKSTDEYMELIRGYSEDADDPGFQRRPGPAAD